MMNFKSHKLSGLSFCNGKFTFYIISDKESNFYLVSDGNMLNLESSSASPADHPILRNLGVNTRSTEFIKSMITTFKLIDILEFYYRRIMKGDRKSMTVMIPKTKYILRRSSDESIEEFLFRVIEFTDDYLSSSYYSVKGD